MTNKKTIFLLIHQQFTTRYLLQTDIFKRLKEFGHRIVIITPNAADEGFCRDFGGKDIFIEQFEYEKIEAVRKKRVYQYFLKTRRFTLPWNLDISTLKLKEKFLRQGLNGQSITKKLFQLLPLLTAKILRRSRLLRDAFVRMESILLLGNFHQKLFEKYNPDLLVLNDLGTIDISNFIMREARSCGVPIVSVILSWDNLTAKGIGVVKPDYAIAWNANMRFELENYHEIPAKRIYIGGIAHFDRYFREENPHTRTVENFKNELGISENKRILFFGTASPSWFKGNLNTIKLIVEACRNGLIVEPIQLVIRLHPVYVIRHRESDAKEMHQIQEFCFDNSDIVCLNTPELIRRNYGFELTAHDQYLFYEILKSTDVLITQFSTLMLEAAILDKPVINIGFDNGRKLEEKTSIMAQSETHLIRVLNTGFARTAETAEQLVELINKYLENPSMDGEARKLIRENEGGPNKSKAGIAIADYIDSILALEKSGAH